jgi:hypothetical protein
MPPHVVIVYPPPFGRLQRRLEGLSKTDWGSVQAVVIEPEPRRPDSPLEGDGFEPSVPGTKEPVFVAEGELRTEPGQPKRVVSYAVPMVRIHLPPARSLVRT